MSKGSAHRPLDRAKFDAEFERIFGPGTSAAADIVWDLKVAIENVVAEKQRQHPKREKGTHAEL